MINNSYKIIYILVLHVCYKKKIMQVRKIFSIEISIVILHRIFININIFCIII